MKYIVYYNGNKCKVYNNDNCYNIFQYVKGKHIWPEDNTSIDFSYSNGVITYSITNMSDRTKYLLDNDLLALGLFVIEHKANFISPKWRGAKSVERHRNRKWCNDCYWHISSASGQINVGDLPHSHVLSMLFGASSEHNDPYRPDGYDDYYLGIGRDANGRTDVGFRPHKISDTSIRVWSDNDY